MFIFPSVIIYAIGLVALIMFLLFTFQQQVTRLNLLIFGSVLVLFGGLLSLVGDTSSIGLHQILIVIGLGTTVVGLFSKNK